MNKEETSLEIVKNLLQVMPNWHSRLVRPFKELLQKEMSLETYYCLQTIKIGGVMTMGELAHELNITKQHVTKLVDSLYRHEFVKRQFNEQDRRTIQIGLTPKAIEYLNDYHHKNPDFLKMLTERLSNEELIELNESMKTLGKVLPKLHEKIRK